MAVEKRPHLFLRQHALPRHLPGDEIRLEGVVVQRGAQLLDLHPFTLGEGGAGIEELQSLLGQIGRGGDQWRGAQQGCGQCWQEAQA
ncbi:MAG: hypothetical protein Kow0096_21750 [Thiohalomonadaceae bacterium]